MVPRWCLGQDTRRTIDHCVYSLILMRRTVSTFIHSLTMIQSNAAITFGKKWDCLHGNRASTNTIPTIVLMGTVRRTARGRLTVLLRHIRQTPPCKRRNGRATCRTVRPRMQRGILKFYPWGDDGPPRRGNEARRHVYRRDGVSVRIKIKNASNGNGSAFVNWYRVRDGDVTCWQAKKPDSFQSVSYIGAINPFDSELVDNSIFWPEGEKDCDTLGRKNMPAFTFGGCGDGLPNTAAKYLSKRHIVILADNDDPGRDHAEKKAALAHGVGAASIRILHFPELPVHGDVTDFFKADGTVAELMQRVEAAPLWCPPQIIENTPPQETNGRALVILRASDIEMTPVAWLWPHKLALGKLSLIAGEPGLGKSQLTASLAAAVTTGGLWPCSCERAPLGNVVIFSAEDDPSDTVVPRLKAAGADLDRVRIVSSVESSDGRGKTQHSFNLQTDLALLESAITNLGDVRLTNIDPITSYLGKVDSHKNAEIRSVLEPVAQMAVRRGVAVVGVTHFSKSGSTSAINRFIGSIGFIVQLALLS